jgi:predicted nucleic acid-binding protein
LKKKALTLFGHHGVDIVDAIVFMVAKHHGWSMFSFDKDMRKLEREADRS